jgi:hypothetical protein
MRTQLYVPKSIYQRIELLASQENKPKAEVLADLLDFALRHRQTETVGQALSRLVRLGQKLKVKGPKDLSTNLDHYLYDDN